MAKSPEEIIKQHKAERREMGVMLTAPAGSRLIQELEEELDKDDLVGATPEATYFNLGARSVVRLLKNLRKEAQEG